jgi:hypothetical protein
MTPAKQDALTLLLEDLHTIHSNIRTEAKQLGCERELEDLRDEVIQFLKKK